MKKRIDILPVFIVLYIFVVLALYPLTVTGQDNSIPKLINYQGYLTDKDGKALNGDYNITFRLYGEASGTKPWLWQETQETVKADNGQFNVLLGSVTPLSASDFAGDRYLGIQLAGELEMTPRLQLVSVAYSLQTEQANNAKSADLANNATNAVHATNADLANSAYALDAPDGFPKNAVSVDNNGDVNILGWQDQKLNSTNGYIVIGSLIIQWGNFVMDSDGVMEIQFAKAFPNKCCSVFVNRQVENPSSAIEAYGFGKTSFKLNRDNNIDGTPMANYIAVGY